MAVVRYTLIEQVLTKAGADCTLVDSNSLLLDRHVMSGLKAIWCTQIRFLASHLSPGKNARTTSHPRAGAQSENEGDIYSR